MQNRSVFERWIAAGVDCGAILFYPSVPVAEREVDQRAADAARREWEALVKRVNREAKKGSAV
jgi:hypothetical protein